MIRVLIMEPRSSRRDQLVSNISAEPDMQVLDIAETFPQALAHVQDADLVVAHTSVPDDGAYQLAWVISRRDICVPMLVAGADEAAPAIVRYFEAGARGFIRLPVEPERLVKSLRCVWQGEVLFDPHWLPALLARFVEVAEWIDDLRQPTSAETKLTRREREVLQLIGRNFTNQDIANHLIIEVGTVKNHVHNILAKLKVNSRAEAAAYLHMLRDRNRAVKRSRRYGTAVRAMGLKNASLASQRGE
jgi:DNA-binding NarL/FixJ family response regulator